MTDKPKTAADYSVDQLRIVREACLYLATKLGDLTDHLVVVGGLAPPLLIDQESLAEGADHHVGTMDLDVGLAVALVESGAYRSLSERLRRAGFAPDENEQGNRTRQRWAYGGEKRVTLDFLIAPSTVEDRGGALRSLQTDLAAIIAPGLHLAFRDRTRVLLRGRTLVGEHAEREIWVSGPGAYVVLKALAFDGRGENKDAYDLYYVVRNYGGGPEDVSERLRPLLDDAAANTAVGILRRDFASANDVGPRRVAEFIAGRVDEEIQADVVGFVGELIRRLEGPSEDEGGLGT